jgi:hypothetical protein
LIVPRLEPVKLRRNAAVMRERQSRDGAKVDTIAV